MAWGDLRFDHSDIFGENVPKQHEIKGKPPGKELGPGDPQWNQILEICRYKPKKAKEIAKEFGYTHLTGNVWRLLIRMVNEGVIVREREPRERARGQIPFYYRTAKK